MDKNNTLRRAHELYAWLRNQGYDSDIAYGLTVASTHLPLPPEVYRREYMRKTMRLVTNEMAEELSPEQK